MCACTHDLGQAATWDRIMGPPGRRPAGTVFQRQGVNGAALDWVGAGSAVGPEGPVSWLVVRSWCPASLYGRSAGRGSRLSRVVRSRWDSGRGGAVVLYVRRSDDGRGGRLRPA